MNNSFKQTFQHCINQCEKTINALQILVAKCISADRQECAREIGHSTNEVTQAMDACNACISECNIALTQETDRQKKQMFVNCIEVCKECVDECDSLIRECKSGNDTCVENAEDCIQALEAASSECERCIESK